MQREDLGSGVARVDRDLVEKREDLVVALLPEQTLRRDGDGTAAPSGSDRGLREPGRERGVGEHARPHRRSEQQGGIGGNVPVHLRDRLAQEVTAGGGQRCAVSTGQLRRAQR